MTTDRRRRVDQPDAVVWITATLAGALANAALIGGAVSLFRNGQSFPGGTDRPRPSGASPGS